MPDSHADREEAIGFVDRRCHFRRGLSIFLLDINSLDTLYYGCAHLPDPELAERLFRKALEIAAENSPAVREAIGKYRPR